LSFAVDSHVHATHAEGTIGGCFLRVFRVSLVILTLGVTLSACVRYHPAPITPADQLSARAQRTLLLDRSWATATLLETAIDWSPGIRAKAAGYRSAAAAARAARVPLPAALQLTAEYSHQDNPDKPWLGSGALDLPVDLGGRRNARVSAADLAMAQARYDYADAVWATRSAIRHAIINRLHADQALPLAERARDLRRDRLERLQLRVRAGEDPQTVVLLARSELASAERRLQDNVARRRDAGLALAQALGTDLAATQALSLSALPATADAPGPVDLTRLRQEAALGRSDVLRAILDYDLAENGLRLEVASQYPALRVQPGYTYERGVVKLPLGINLQLPPIDSNRAAIRAAESRRAEAGVKLEAVQAAVLAEVDRADAALAAGIAVERVRATQDLPAARKTAENVAAALKAGELDRVDEEAAAAAAVEAELDGIEASRSAWLAKADLEDALRHTDDPAEAKIIEAAMARLGEKK
jgi:outer membrane protein, heavy metal efflux system